MKCLIDTNILVSAALFPHSVPARAFMKAVNPPGNAVVCDYSMDEMRRVFNEWLKATRAHRSRNSCFECQQVNNANPN